MAGLRAVQLQPRPDIDVAQDILEILNFPENGTTRRFRELIQDQTITPTM
jgi:hypothetical protein